jgi:hypothetical protein
MSAVIPYQPASSLQRQWSSPSDFWLTLLLLCVSGNMFFIESGRDHIVLTLFAVALAWLLFRHGFRIDKKLLYVSAGFLVIFLGQYAFFKFLPIVTILGFYMKLFIGFAVIKLVADFPLTYVRTMRIVVLISLAFWIPDQMLHLAGVDFRAPFRPLADLLNVQTTGTNVRINIGIYNFQTGVNASRNAAFFWEPGAFAGYLLLGIVFLSLCKERISRRYFVSSFILLVVGILTTRSTTGIVVLPLALMLLMKVKRKNFRNLIKSFLLLLAGVCFLLLFALSVSQLEFVGEKMVNLYERALYQQAGWHTSRFGAMLFDWEYIRQNPLFGWGQSNQTQYRLHPDFGRYALGNGMTGFLRQMGLLGMGIFLFSFFRGLRRNGMSKLRSFYILCVILLTLNGEYFLMHPVFLGLMFLQIPRIPMPTDSQVRIRDA